MEKIDDKTILSNSIMIIDKEHTSGLGFGDKHKEERKGVKLELEFVWDSIKGETQFIEKPLSS